MGLISGNFEAILFEPKESWPTKLKSPLPCRRVYGGGGEGGRLVVAVRRGGFWHWWWLGRGTR